MSRIFVWQSVFDRQVYTELEASRSFLLVLVLSVRCAKCEWENPSLTDRAVSYNGQTQPGRIELQDTPPPLSQQRAHCNCQFCEGLTPAIMFAVLTLLIVGSACMGSSMIDCSSYKVLLTS
ncbi:MAG: hypothetical protein WBA39_34125 [Rivularia sp. (in: cyanobacteria)]